MTLQIKCIAESPSSVPPAIVFFHGLAGHGSQTWMLDPRDERTLWPKWLADDFQCSVFLVAYDSGLSRWKDSAMPLPDQGDALLEYLSSEPLLKGRPLVFVGHSMGGLVIKTMIHNGLTKGVSRYRSIVEQIRGVVFIGTPHNGAQLAKLATYLSPLLRTNSQVKSMQTHDAHLRSLNQQFRAYCSNPPNGKVSVISFTETKGLLVGKRFLGVNFGPMVTIIGPNDGDAHIEGEIPIQLAEDHISICKIKNKQQPLYKSLLRFLREALDLSFPVSPSQPTKLAGRESSISIQAGHGSIVSSNITSAVNISAGSGSVAAAVINGSVSINNKEK